MERLWEQVGQCAEAVNLWTQQDEVRLTNDMLLDMLQADDLNLLPRMTSYVDLGQGRPEAPSSPIHTNAPETELLNSDVVRPHGGIEDGVEQQSISKRCRDSVVDPELCNSVECVDKSEERQQFCTKRLKLLVRTPEPEESRVKDKHSGGGSDVSQDEEGADEDMCSVGSLDAGADTGDEEDRHSVGSHDASQDEGIEEDRHRVGSLNASQDKGDEEDRHSIGGQAEGDEEDRHSDEDLDASQDEGYEGYGCNVGDLDASQDEEDEEDGRSTGGQDEGGGGDGRGVGDLDASQDEGEEDRHSVWSLNAGQDEGNGVDKHIMSEDELDRLPMPNKPKHRNRKSRAQSSHAVSGDKYD
jgi:hypothetical protein